MRIVIDIPDEEKTAKILSIDTKDSTIKQYNVKPKKRSEELSFEETETPPGGWLMWLVIMVIVGFIFLYGLTNGRIGDLFK